MYIFISSIFNHDQQIIIIDVATSMVLFRKHLENSLTSINWTRSDELLLLGDSSGELYIWDVITGTIEYHKKLHEGEKKY